MGADAQDDARNDDWDFDAEWASYERAESSAVRESDADNGSDSTPVISGYSLLYSGFFAGPAATFVTVLILMERGFRPRVAVFSLGVLAATWLTIQGATLWLGEMWPLWQVQALRTALNLSAGSICLGYWRHNRQARPGWSRSMLINTGVYLLLLVALFGFLSPDLLFWLGR